MVGLVVGDYSCYFKEETGHDWWCLLGLGRVRGMTKQKKNCMLPNVFLFPLI